VRTPLSLRRIGCSFRFPLHSLMEEHFVRQNSKLRVLGILRLYAALLGVGSSTQKGPISSSFRIFYMAFI